MFPHRRRSRLWLPLLVSAMVAVACGSSDSGDTDPGAGEPASSFELIAVDYAYSNSPETLAVGTELQMVNESDAEAHEAVVVRLPEDEERSVEELLELSDEEADLLIEQGFAGVLVAMPGEEAFAPEGPVVLDEPGRYMVVCALPIGHDPEVVAAAMEEESEGPPDFGDAPPHFTAGMITELRVEG